MQIDENASSYDKGAQVGNLGLKYGTGKDKATPSDDETVLKMVTILQRLGFMEIVNGQ